MKINFANHCSYQIRYHQVFCIKYRKQLLRKEEYRIEIKHIIKEICERYDFEIDEMGTDGYHIHLFVGATPKRSPSEIMQILKSIIAKQMFKRFPEIKRMLWGGEFWSDGGYIGTVLEGTNEEIVRKYIANQVDEKGGYMGKQLKLFSIK